MADAASLALRDARISLWRDLWAKTEDVDQQIEDATRDLTLENQRLRKTIRNLRRSRPRRA